MKCFEPQKGPNKLISMCTLCSSWIGANYEKEKTVKVMALGAIERVIVGKALSIATCGSQTDTEVTTCDKMLNLLTIRLLQPSCT